MCAAADWEGRRSMHGRGWLDTVEGWGMGNAMEREGGGVEVHGLQ